MNYKLADLVRNVAEHIISKPLLPTYITVPVKSDGRPPRAPRTRAPRTR